MNNPGNHFIIVDANLVAMGRQAEAVLLGIVYSFSKKFGYCFASNKTLGLKMKRSDRPARRYLAWLKSHGYVAASGHGGRRRIWVTSKASFYKAGQHCPGGGQNSVAQPGQLCPQSNINNQQSGDIVNAQRRNDSDAIYKSGRAVSIAAFFDRLWQQYPNPIGKDVARIRYHNTLSSIEDDGLAQAFAETQKALQIYLASDRVKNKHYIQDGRRWFAEWRGWLDYKDAKVYKPQPRSSRSL